MSGAPKGKPLSEGSIYVPLVWLCEFCVCFLPNHARTAGAGIGYLTRRALKMLSFAVILGLSLSVPLLQGRVTLSDPAAASDALQSRFATSIVPDPAYEPLVYAALAGCLYERVCLSLTHSLH